MKEINNFLNELSTTTWILLAFYDGFMFASIIYYYFK